MKTIDGNTLRDMIISGAGNLQTHKQQVNDLNVFPVPDGDTGTNMSLTMQSAVNELTSIDGVGTDKISSVTASALLRGARGNSGVITSLLFRGISKGIASLTEVDAAAFAAAYKKGVEAAYKAVMKPTEGTILTVSRLGADAGIKAAEKGDILETFEAILNESKVTLEKTPDMLPVLKQAGVVDSGGAGLVCILEGMYSVLKDGIIMKGEEAQPQQAKADFASFEAQDIKFAYCTEFLVNKNEKTAGRDVEDLHKFALNNGDSVVFVDDDEIIKLHVHTNHPGKVIEKALDFGFLSKLKIENMKEQLEREKAEKTSDTPKAEEPVAQETSEGAKITPATPEKKYGFVAVTAGEGMNDLFTDLGADGVVFGGQTMNPSADDIYKIVENVPAETVFIFPNNKNIIMAAELVGPLSEKEIVVVPTRTVPEGVSAMLAFDESADSQANLENMKAAAANVKTGQVTYAVRDSIIGDTSIKEGQIMGLCGGAIKALGSDVTQTTAELVESMVDENSQLVTIYYGDSVKEDEASVLTEKLSEKYPNMEIMSVCGKQPVYFYIVSVE